MQTNSSGYPIVQGIELVPTSRLPDRLRSCFKFKLFNAIQSECFSSIFEGDDNLVLSSPTGSGKTVIFELAICRLFALHSQRSFKIVYQAPIKSLCSERRRDWESRFNHLGLNCVELTGDSASGHMKNITNADIIITTPEKWDSMTRKWRDHQKLMDLVKLFLIDEVHILKEDRGACLETVVSRMKSVGNGVRFVALSATVPNPEDIAEWLGRNPENPISPATMKVFGEEFRPVKLRKFVKGIPACGENDFAFDRKIDKELPSVIMQASKGKPIIVFCPTRKITETTAALLAEWWEKSVDDKRCWPAPNTSLSARDEALDSCINTGVAFHHAGLAGSDRSVVEQAYLDGIISVICCTSTLSVGVNLPCHLVIIKNTVGYQADGCKEYPDLEIMQMMGRAGRPQFDNDAIAVILTRQEKVSRYEKMVSGQELLESRLHVNLIEHLNAEVGLGTITDHASAGIWLQHTFLYVRLRKNAAHYRILDEDVPATLHERLDELCTRDLRELTEYQLIVGKGDRGTLITTEFGDAMARYYIQFSTMKLLMGLQRKPKISEMLSVIGQAADFRTMRLRAGEKALYQELNKSPYLKFPIKVDLAMTAHKVSLIIQAALSGLDVRHDDRFKKLQKTYSAEEAMVFQHVHRLIRCIVDCQLAQDDSVGVRNALELSRSLAARAWDDSPFQLSQLDGIGPAAVRKFVSAGIKTIEELDDTDSHKINMIMARNPPFGMQLLEKTRTYPRLHVSLKKMGTSFPMNSDGVKTVEVKIRAEVGFMNEKVPLVFLRKPVYVCLLAETSDGQVLHFCRLSAQKIDGGMNVFFTALLTNAQQLINCHVSCDDIAGTQKSATCNPDIPANQFPKTESANANNVPAASQSRAILPMKSTNRNVTSFQSSRHLLRQGDNADFDDLDDADLQRAVQGPEFSNIDPSAHGGSYMKSILAGTGKPRVPSREAQPQPLPSGAETWQPIRLRNGRWACNHKCKDKRHCKHDCCRDGTDKPPKPPKASKDSNKEPSPNKSITDMKGFSQKSKPSSHDGPACERTTDNRKNSADMRSTSNKLTKKSHRLPEWDEFSDGGLEDSLLDYAVNSNATTHFDGDHGEWQRPGAAIRSPREKDRPSKGGHSLFFHGTSSPQVSSSSIREIDLGGERVKRSGAAHAVSPLQHKSKSKTKPPPQPAATSTHATPLTIIESSTKRSRPVEQDRPSHGQARPAKKQQQQTSHATHQNHVTLAELEAVEPFHSLQPAAPSDSPPLLPSDAIDLDDEDTALFRELDPSIRLAMDDAHFPSGGSAQPPRHDDDYDDDDDGDTSHYAQMQTAGAGFQSVGGSRGAIHGPTAAAVPLERVGPLTHHDPDEFDDDALDDPRLGEPHPTGNTARQSTAAEGAQTHRTLLPPPPRRLSPRQQAVAESKPSVEQAALDWITREFGGYVDFV